MSGKTLNMFGTLVPNSVGFKIKDSNGTTQTYVQGAASPAPTPWVRPSDWPDLSQMDVSGDNILYMTSYADEARGFCSFRVTCTGSYTVEVGSISGSTFTADESHSYNSEDYCQLYYGSLNGTYKVIRLTGSNITDIRFKSSTDLTIDGHNVFASNQGIIDVVGKATACNRMICSSLYNLVNVKIDGLILSGSMASMFHSCYSLSSIDVSSWNTSNVTSMEAMFTYCVSLTYFDANNWNTSNVTTMTNMFSSCISLISLDVGGWNTSNVTTMTSMFSSCYSLTSLDVSGWNTGKVTSMSSMFSNCYSLTSLDVSNWDMSKVSSIGSIFYQCASLTSLDVSNWVFGTLYSSNAAFQNCYSLISIDVSNWDMSKVTNMSNMFVSCYSLTSLDVSDWDVSKVTNMSGIFQNCYSLTSLDVSGWNTGSATNMSSMFTSCSSLTSLDVSGFITDNVTSMGNMFSYCFSLKSIDVSDWNTGKVTAMGSMFYNCYNLALIYGISGFTTNNVTNIGSMFNYCYSLTSLDVSSWDFTKITSTNNSSYMFSNCGVYGSITIPASMAFMGNSCFASMRNITEWHFLATTPPSLGSSAFSYMTDFGGKKIYVPYSADHSILNAYKAATNWSSYASYIYEEPQS